MESRQNLQKVCPIIQKIQDVEKVKVGLNPYLNVKDIKSDCVFQMYKKAEHYSQILQPRVIVTMDDLEESQHPMLKMQNLINE